MGTRGPFLPTSEYESWSQNELGGTSRIMEVEVTLTLETKSLRVESFSLKREDSRVPSCQQTDEQPFLW